MILPDWKIVEELLLGNIEIDPVDIDLDAEIQNTPPEYRDTVESSDMIQPSSVDVHLGEEFIRFDTDPRQSHIDPFEDHDYGSEMERYPDGLLISPGEFILGKTEQRVSIPPGIRGTVEGRSSWGRLAVIPHTQAGYIDPGYEGNITLEIVNLGPMAIELTPGRRFCQLEFAQLQSEAVSPYEGKYQSDRRTQGSRLQEDVR